MLLLLFLFIKPAYADSSTFCAALSPYFSENKTQLLQKVSRKPTPSEQTLIDQPKLKLLEAYSDYGKWAELVDIDNDGKEELLASNIQGLSRSAITYLHDINEDKTFTNRGFIEQGDYDHQLYFRFQGKNYFSYRASLGGFKEGTTISEINKLNHAKFEQRTLCTTETTPEPQTTCTHSACNALSTLIANPQLKDAFTHYLWSRPYLPDGIEAFF